MGTFKLQVPAAKLLFTQVLNAGGRRFLAWNARSPRVSAAQPAHAPANVIESSRRFETRAIDSALMSEFHARLRQTDDLIGKLGFSLREITRR